MVTKKKPVHIWASPRFYKTISNMQDDIMKTTGLKLSQSKATDIISNMLVGKKIVFKKVSRKRWLIE